MQNPEPNADELDKILDDCTVGITQYEDQMPDGASVTVKDYDNRVIDTFRLKSKLQTHDRTRALAILEEVEREVIGKNEPTFNPATVTHNVAAAANNNFRAKQRTAIARLKDKYGGHDA